MKKNQLNFNYYNNFVDFVYFCSQTNIIMHDLTEHKLLAQLKKGNQNAFRIIFDEHYSLLCAIAYHYVKDTSVSQILAEDALLSIWEKHEDIIFTTSLKAYLMRTVRNKSIDYLRSSKIEETFINIEEAGSHCFIPDEELFEKYVLAELEQKIEEAINTLPDECKNVFIMSRYDDRSYQEIADYLNISINTVKYHMKHALSLLRKELKDYLAFIIIFHNLWY